MQDSQKFAETIAVKKYQRSADIKAEPEYYLTHNQECAKFRQELMANSDEFTRGYTFGTACICHGAEDRVLHNVKVTITRYYEKDEYSVITIQNGNLQADNASAEALHKKVSRGEKIDPAIHAGFGPETVIELNVG